MLIKLATGRIYYDLTGPENGQVVCFTHSLASDGGMWAEQLPPLLAAGYRVLRLDMRGHGGSDAVAGDYTMEQLADDVAGSLDFLGITRVQFIGLSIGGMLGQAFAIKYGQRLISAMLCDTSPQTPPGAQEAWAPRIDAVKKANAGTPCRPDDAALVHRCLQTAQSRAMEADPRHDRRYHTGRLSGLRRGHPQFRLRAEAVLGEGADAGGVRRE